jgi:hypothetical protein
MASVATIATPLVGALAVNTASPAARYAQPMAVSALPARRSIAGAALRKSGEYCLAEEWFKECLYL